MKERYDIIGDIHGMSATFRAVLAKLGYRQKAGRWSHPDARVLVSVGDLLDRGPDPLGALEIMSQLVRDGCGRMVLGNHEVNALHFSTTHRIKGTWLREHSEKNRAQFDMTQRQISADPTRWKDLKDFLKTVPSHLQLDSAKLRIVHACWGYDFLDAQDLPVYLDDADSLERTADKAGLDIMYRAVECCIKGPEQPCAPWHDKDGFERNTERVPWWETYPETAPFVAFGHYWFPWPGRPNTAEPAFLGPGKNSVCLDFSLGKGKKVAVCKWPERQLLSFDCIDQR